MAEQRALAQPRAATRCGKRGQVAAMRVTTFVLPLAAQALVAEPEGNGSEGDSEGYEI